MKYVLAWKTRPGGSAQENLAGTKRSLEVFSKWQPSGITHQFLARVDAQGGFAVGETDDPAELARDCAIFSPYLEFEVLPVLDIQEGAEILTQAVDFNEKH